MKHITSDYLYSNSNNVAHTYTLVYLRRCTVGLEPSSVEFSLFSLALNSDGAVVDYTPQLHVIENNYKIINISFQNITHKTIPFGVISFKSECLFFIIIFH